MREDVLPHVCPLCGAAYGSQWAADECRDIDREEDRRTRQATRRT